jgi:hypothetical protein
MTHGLFFTAYDRVDYLRQTLESWESVRGIQDWHVVARIEPSPVEDTVIELFEAFFERTGVRRYEIVVNERVLGVLHHPFVGFSELFLEHDFVVRAEDDLVVSDDILEYFTWAEKHYRNTKFVATINAFSKGRSEHDCYVIPYSRFNPWVWGTWRSVWDMVFAPLWDHDYSTFSGTPGFMSGWDWNIDVRIFPRYGFEAIYPMNSRVQNIGEWGVHGTPDNLQRAQVFKHTYGEQEYRPFFE